MNGFGRHFILTTWGESHGDAIGGVIDGMPSGITLDMSVIAKDMARRAPGRRTDVSLRQEQDEVVILSGVYQGKTTGAPLSFSINNQDARSKDYHALPMRPGHADITYAQKYGHYDPRGGGRASARETAVRVAAASMAKQAMAFLKIQVHTYLCQVGTISMPLITQWSSSLRPALSNDEFPCSDPVLAAKMQDYIRAKKKQGDSCGGVVGFIMHGVPKGLGEPVYHKFEALLANAMMSIPASKGFDIGEGFEAASMCGSDHNDVPNAHGGFDSNHAGGLLGGITTGQTIYGRVAFKPTSSIAQPQQTIDQQHQPVIMAIQGRHDPCVAIRATVVVEAMCWLTLMDYLQPSWAHIQSQILDARKAIN